MYSVQSVVAHNRVGFSVHYCFYVVMIIVFRKLYTTTYLLSICVQLLIIQLLNGVTVKYAILSALCVIGLLSLWHGFNKMLDTLL